MSAMAAMIARVSSRALASDSRSIDFLVCLTTLGVDRHGSRQANAGQSTPHRLRENSKSGAMIAPRRVARSDSWLPAKNLVGFSHPRRASAPSGYLEWI